MSSTLLDALAASMPDDEPVLVEPPTPTQGFTIPERDVAEESNDAQA